MASRGFRPAGMSDDESDASVDDFSYAFPSSLKESASSKRKREEGIARNFWMNRLNDSKDDDGTMENLSNSQKLQDAITNGDVEKVKSLLEDGNLSCDQPLTSGFFSSGKRPIFLAAEEGQPGIVEYLIDKGCLLTPDDDNFNPLMSACGSSELERDRDLAKVAKLLITKGRIDPNTFQTQKITPLMLACKHGLDEVVKELLNYPLIEIDQMDSQRWTALMYSIDSDHGHIARRLLEAGARPDLATIDGLLPIDLAVTKDMPNLRIIIEDFMKAKGIDVGEPDNAAVIKYSEIDNILLALEASDLMPIFKDHSVTLSEFLQFSEAELIEIGVEKVGLRKKMLDAISDMHKRQWEKTSVPKITPRDKQNGLYLSAPDGALMISSASRHLKLLTANVEFLARHIRDKPEMLKIGQDVASPEDIANFSKEAQINLNSLQTSLTKLNKAITKQVKPKSSFFPVKLSILAFLPCLAVIMLYLMKK